MSILSNLLKNNTVKVGIAIAAGSVAKEYLYGTYSGPSYLPTGELVEGRYTGNNIGSGILNFLNIDTPFSETKLGQSAFGDAIRFMGPGGPGGKLLGSVGSKISKANQPPDVSLVSTTGYGVGLRGGDAGFNPGQAQRINLGNGGALTAALGRDGTQQYLAKKVRGLGLPTVSSLPRPTASTGAIQTTSMQSRAYKKLGLAK